MTNGEAAYMPVSEWDQQSCIVLIIEMKGTTLAAELTFLLCVAIRIKAFVTDS